MNRIKRFKESTEHKSKMERDLDDLLTKLQFIDETYSMNGDNGDDQPFQYFFADEDYSTLVYNFRDKLHRPKEVHKGVYFHCQLDSVIDCYDDDYDVFKDAANFYIEYGRILKETMEAIEIYTDDYMLTGFEMSLSDNYIQFYVFSKENEKIEYTDYGPKQVSPYDSMI